MAWNTGWLVICSTFSAMPNGEILIKPPFPRQTACEVSGHRPADHFVGVNKMVGIGSGTQREIHDVMLTRNACYLARARCSSPRRLRPHHHSQGKDFATEITIHNARTHQMGNEPEILREHVTNNAAARHTLLSRGIRPETLPAVEDVKKVESPLTSDEKKALKNPDQLEGE